VHGLPAGEPLDRGGGVGSCEDEEREVSGLVEVGRVGGDAEVVNAQADADVGGSEFVPELVVVPEDLGVGEVMLGDLGHQSGIRNV
jgi:hypothetical protein